MDADTEAIAISKLTETVSPAELSPEAEDRNGSTDYYPFATVLRIRVLQIVFGISFLIMGSVAFIEERGKLNLGLGIPAGISTIIATGASIHTTRGFGGYRTSTCAPGSPLRFLGSTVKTAVPLSILWTMAFSFLAALVVQAAKTLAGERRAGDAPADDDLLILASGELCLAVCTLVTVLMMFRIDCKFDPD